MKTARSRFLLIVLSLIAATIVLVSTRRYGAGLSPDSVNYVAAARSLAAGKGLVMYDGSPFAILAPFYPALLGSISRVTGLDPLFFAHIVNAVFFAAIIFLSGLLLSEYLSFSPTLAFLGTIAVLVRQPLVQVSVMAWTEPLFILCTLIFLVSASLYVKSGSRASLVVMTLSAAAAPLVRYVGVVLIPVGVLMILFRSQTPLKTRILRLLSFLVISLAPWGAWVTRNYLLTGTLMGPRYSSTSSLLANLRLTVLSILSGFIGSRHGRLVPVRILSAVALVSTAIAAGFVLLRRWRTADPRARAHAGLRLADPLLLFTALYMILIVVSSTTTAYDPIDNRLMSPVYVPIVVLLFALVDRSIGSLRVIPFGRYGRTALLAVIALWLVSPAAEVRAGSLNRSRRGAGGL
jgi:hypothetical protein